MARHSRRYCNSSPLWVFCRFSRGRARFIFRAMNASVPDGYATDILESIGCIFLGLLGTASVLGWQFFHKLEHEAVKRFSDHRWAVPSKVYARPLLLYPGLNIEEIALFESAGTLGLSTG